jgi:CrcB protein
MILALGIGLMGALGAVARYLTVEWVARWWRGRLPLATLLINFAGAFALGLVTGLFVHPAQQSTRLLLGTGFLGGYTTFSTLSYETLTLARRGETRVALVNVGVSLAGGLILAALGLRLGYAL